MHIASPHAGVRRIHRSGARLCAALVAVALGAALILSGCGSTATASGQASTPPLGFRSLPTFLPTSSPVDTVVTASAAHPRLAVQGVAVNVDLSGGRVLALVTGPRVPPFVAPPPPAVTATFAITLTHASGTVPIRLADFTITDQLGRTFHPTLVTGEKAPPSAVPPGRTVSFQVTAVMPTGEGRLHWAPGGKTLVGWDFVVEND